MAKLTYFKNYNNYFNSIEKNNKQEDLTGYDKVTINDINFNSNDGLTTELIVNWSNTWTPDYMMVDLDIDDNSKAYWTNYMTGFYFMQSSSSYDMDVTGTNEEVLESLSRYPVWDYDLEEYVYRDYYNYEGHYLNMSQMIEDQSGDINDNYFCFGMDFTGLKVKTLNMFIDPKYWETNPITRKYALITVQCESGKYIVIDTRDLQGNIDFALLKSYDSTITENDVITNIEFNPNTQYDVTEQTYGPYIISALPSEYNLNNTMESSWFVTEFKRTRKGQYHALFKRDLIADNYDKVINSPILLNRGMVDKNNPLIYNDEGFNLNQIKTNETLLKQTDIPYLVLYFAKNSGDKSALPVKAEFTPTPDIEINTPLSEDPRYNPGTYKTTARTDNFKFNMQFTVQTSSRGYTGNWRAMEYNIDWNTSNINEDGAATTFIRSPLTYDVINPNNYSSELKNPLDNALWGWKNNIVYAFRSTQTGCVNESYVSDIDSLTRASKVLRDSTGKYYRLSAKKVTKNVNNSIVQTNNLAAQELTTRINTKFPQWTPWFGEGQTTLKYWSYRLSYEYYEYEVQADELNDYEFNINVTNSTKQDTLDSECQIMLIPYADISITSGIINADISKSTQFNIAQTIAREYTTAKCYDMQLLPYVPSWLSSETTGKRINLSNIDSYKYSRFDYQGTPVGIVFYTDVSTFTFDINQSIDIPLYCSNESINKKISANCDTYRLCSPNYNGIFEFNVAKNNGVNFFNVDVTYKPYNPYIHINPNFKGIYGSDFNDARGLICGGDFSLPITGDAFAQYELNNKNYLNVFNRQIEHMDFEHSIQKISGAASAITGTLQGATTGGMTGAMTGGAYGAIAGAAIGAGTSGIGGVIDYSILMKQQREEKSLAMDMFSYQLGNIKALPYSLNKVNPLTYNNKIFPFIEYYTCTDTEKEILLNKITYMSMNVNNITTIQNCKSNYTEDTDRHFYSGNLIRLEELGLCSNEAFEIYNEIAKGVYI